MPSAKIAVDLFMMISGYLMAANAYSRNGFEPLSSLKNWYRFWLRRFFRLAPAYYLSLVLAVATSSYFLAGYQELQSLNPSRWPVGGVADPSRIAYTPTNIFLHLSFLFGLHPTYSFSTFLPDWSLSLEMQFYFVFPALLLLMNTFGFGKVSLVVGLPVFIIGLYISSVVVYYEPSLLIFKLNYFISGILLFQLIAARFDRSRFLATTIISLLLVSLDYNYGRQIIVLPLLLISMLILGRLEAEGSTPRWLSNLINNRAIHFASDASYGVYLFHGFFISLSGLLIARFSDLATLPAHHRVAFIFVFVTICAYAVAFLVFKLVELPGIRLGKVVIERVSPLAKATPVGTP